MTETTLEKAKKPFYRRRRVWAIVILILSAYFCLVPSRTRISPETTGITGPLTADGKVDYFAAFEKLYIDKLSPPEDNGLRYMIAACGPTILEQMALVEAVPWEEMPTHEWGKNWFENQWLPLCEHLYIDPYKKPMFYDSRYFHSYMLKLRNQQRREAGEEELVINPPEISQLYDKILNAPWRAEDEPEAARWLEQRSPLLDYFAECVRKPNYVCWRKRPEKNLLYSILLPDVQSTREFARELRIRIGERVTRGDLDGAWYDVMTMKHIALHNKKDLTVVANLVGVAIDGMANEAAQWILTYGQPSKEQLAGFLRDLNAFPRPESYIPGMSMEGLVSYDLIQHFKSGYAGEYYAQMTYGSGGEYAKRLSPMMTLLYLPFDANIASKRLSELYSEYGLMNLSLPSGNPVLLRQHLKQIDEAVSQLEAKLKNTQLHRIPLIRTRSKLLAEHIFIHTKYSLSMVFDAITRIEAENEMLKIALALEHVKLTRDEYPANLDALVPTYFLMTPLDPYTGRTSFVYKLTPSLANAAGSEGSSVAGSEKREHPFVLYSLGPNAKDDGGLPLEKSGGSADYDVVFWK